MKKKITIGRLDLADLPELGIENIRIKIDTGAYTSSLHCKKIRIIKEDGIEKLTFKIPGSDINGKKNTIFTTSDFSTRAIKSSNGQIQQRYIIKTSIRIFGKIYKTDFSLTDRSSMKNPILIGRKLLSGKFLVDVSKKDLSYEHKKLKKQ